MLTNNWKILFNDLLDSAPSSITSENLFTYKVFDGGSTISKRRVDVSHAYFSKISNVLSEVAWSSSSGVAFGNGTGNVSADDYALFGNVIKNLTYNVAVSVERDGDTLIKQAIFTITNGNAEEVTISEVGYFGNCRVSHNSNWCMILLDHTLLDEPITIPAGGIGQVTYTITFNIA